jgi:hypothetical protein
MFADRNRLARFLSWTVAATYLSLAVWMHIWTLQVGVALPGEPTKPHHQICTWLGTSGEAGHVTCPGITLNSLVISFHAPPSPSNPVVSVIPSTLQARAPPSF